MGPTNTTRAAILLWVLSPGRQGSQPSPRKNVLLLRRWQLWLPWGLQLLEIAACPGWDSAWLNPQPGQPSPQSLVARRTWSRTRARNPQVQMELLRSSRPRTYVHFVLFFCGAAPAGIEGNQFKEAAVYCERTGVNRDPSGSVELDDELVSGAAGGVDGLFAGGVDGLESAGGDLFEGLADAGWWRQLAREAAEEHEVEYECDPYEEATEEPEVVEAAAERAAQEAMRLQTGGRAKYGELVLRRAVGQQRVEWGSARAGHLGAGESKTPSRDEPVVVEGGRRGRAARRRGRQHQPQQTSATGAGCAAGAEAETLAVPLASLLAQNKFAALAEGDEEVEPAVASEPEWLPGDAEAANEAEAAKALEEHLARWARLCPAYAGSARQAARQEIAAMIAWLPSQLDLHAGEAWQLAIARHLSSCEEALKCMCR